VESYSTAEFSTRFFRPIKAGERMIVDSILLNRSRRLGVIETTFVHAETGKLHAKVTGSWMLAKRDFDEK
jgi:acyl-coenzyme A thioesterase PaaI-like protein